MGGAPRFGAPGTPMYPPYAVCLFVLYKLRYRLYIFTGYRRVLLRYPILARAKNGVFCNVTAPAPPRVGKTVGRRIILSPDMARMTRPLLRKTAKSDSERSLGISEGHRWRRRIICRQLELQNTPKNARRVGYHPVGRLVSLRSRWRLGAARARCGVFGRCGACDRGRQRMR